jgi:IS605 OrfB family transposase
MVADIGAAITDAEQRRRAEQKRRGRTSKGHRLRVEQSFHKLANEIVHHAKQSRAQVVIENLDTQKQTINQKRKKGARKGGWRKTLKKSQLGNLEIILAYKLALAGLKPPQKVFPRNTSLICPRCGAIDPKNRKSQDTFSCTACGFLGHADSVASTNIARRGAQVKTAKKGDKLLDKNQKMVDALQGFYNSGLGPLSASADWIVAGRASANSPNHPITGARLKRGKSSLVSNQNG